MQLKNKTPMTFQFDNDLVDDIRLVAGRRGQTLTKFITLAIEAEMEREADRQVTS